VWEGKYYGQYSLPCNFPGQSDDNNLLLVAVIVGFVLVPCMLLGAFLSCRKKFRAVTNVPIYEDSNEADLAESPMATIILD
jgi:hypothetical protein